MFAQHNKGHHVISDNTKRVIILLMAVIGECTCPETRAVVTSSASIASIAVVFGAFVLGLR